MRGGEQAGQVEDERCGEGGVAAHPRELHGHPRAEEALEGDVVPRGLPVAHVGDVLDVDGRLGVVAEDLGQDPALARGLVGARGRVGQGRPVAAAEDVHGRPRRDPQGAGGEHRRERGLDQRLAGLAVAAGPGQALALGELLQGGQARAGAGGELHHRAAGAEGRVGVQRAGGQDRVRPVERGLERVEGVQGGVLGRLRQVGSRSTTTTRSRALTSRNSRISASMRSAQARWEPWSWATTCRTRPSTCLEPGRDRPDQGPRHDAGVRELLGPLGQRRRGDVVAAEDQVPHRGRPASASAGREVTRPVGCDEVVGEGERPHGRRRRDGAAGAEEPDPGTPRRPWGRSCSRCRDQTDLGGAGLGGDALGALVGVAGEEHRAHLVGVVTLGQRGDDGAGAARGGADRVPVRVVAHHVGDLSREQSTGWSSVTVTS